MVCIDNTGLSPILVLRGAAAWLMAVPRRTTTSAAVLEATKTLPVVALCGCATTLRLMAAYSRFSVRLEESIGH